jgi:hypothetical protein
MKKKAKFLLGAGLLVLLNASNATAGQGRCLLEIDGKTYLSGRCSYFIYPDQTGSFMIGTDGEKMGKYFAQVSIEKDGSADASWNGGESSHADAKLGDVQRKGACWENKSAKLCLWK